MHTDQVKPLSQWLVTVMPDLSPKALALQPLSGDAGARRYYRIEPEPERLAVYAPPETEKNEIFVELADYLRQQGIHAPRIHAADFERGFLLIDNLGERLYLSDLCGSSVEALYGEALMTLLRMQQSPTSIRGLGDYDRPALLAELQLFPEWFVGRLLGHRLDEAEQGIIEATFETLVESALEQPSCFVHRDYHSRNLIHREIGPPGVIDFQDAVWGPFTYDLVSLLRDCYVRWPRESVERWALAYACMAREVGIAPADMSAEQFMRWFDLMGAQRHIKVLGIFARLWLRDHKPGYLNDLPLVIRYTLEVLEEYPNFSAFVEWFKRVLLPLAQEQSWYTDYRTAGYTPH